MEPAEIKPIQNVNRRNYLKISLPLAGMFLLLGGVFLTVNNALQDRQDNRTRASTAATYIIGTTTIGASSDTGNSNSIHCNQYTASTNGTFASINTYISNVDSYEKTYAMGIYTDSSNNPGTLVAKTANGQLVEGWNTLPITGQVSGGAKYWLCFDSKTANDAKNNMRFTSGSSPIVWKDVTFGTWPATYGTKSGGWNGTISIYATVNMPVTPTTPYYPPTATKAPTAVPTVAYPTATRAPTAVPTVAYPTATRVPTQVPTVAYPTATTVPTIAYPTATITPTYAPVATNTPVPGTTYLGVNLLLHGLGKGGDSVNAGGTGNMNPLHPQRTVTVEVYDVQNQLVVSKQGTVIFNATLGNFSGNIDLGTQFSTGIYTVKVKADQSLRGLVSGIQTITQGQTTTMTSLTLVTGDVNNDNAINIVDYNIVVGCYSDLLPPVSCNAINTLRADLNDDGNVNQFDYNLFIRELTNLGGQ